MKKLILASALVLSVTAAFGEVPSPTGCSARVYDKAHLAAHPDQRHPNFHHVSDGTAPICESSVGYGNLEFGRKSSH